MARAYGAVCTPDFFGYDAELRLRYRGRLDAGRKQPVADAPRALFEAVQRIGGGRLRRRPAMGRAREWRAA